MSRIHRASGHHCGRRVGPGCSGSTEVEHDAGEARPGGDVIHDQDGNALTHARTRFVATMMCAPGRPMLQLVGEKEPAERTHLRAPCPTG
ncbi:hypothetical protein SAMN05216533_8021 [Streptomyces sp. Ag109_O5-10]|nr:hypothetical protein SAMN05216533_8021 [Streptomyces sp. Ag109_O5-10]